MILPPHSSHLTQLLDIGIFGPLKMAMSAETDPLIRTDVNRIQKAEWLNTYDKSTARSFTAVNIIQSWKDASLVPFYPSKVIRHIDIATSPPRPSTPETVTPFDSSLITSSPTDITAVCIANNALNEMIKANEPLSTPARNYIVQLTKSSEQLHA